jgi:hypothetical protein
MTRDAFTPSEARLVPPSVPVRHWHTALFLSISGALTSFAGFAFALWRPLPLLGAPPVGGFASHLAGWGNVLLCMASGGHIARADTQEYLDLLSDLASNVPETPWATWSRFVLSLGVGLTIGVWLLRAALVPRNAEQHLAGARLLTGREALRAAKREAARLRSGAPGLLCLHPAFAWPRSHWVRHCLIVGSVGSGKSQIILPLVNQLVAADQKAIIFDSKGEFTQAFPEALLISPFDARTAIWDVGADVTTRDDAVVFAGSLIPENEKNPFFHTSSQMLLTGIVWSLQTDYGPRWSWRALAARMALPAEELTRLLQVHYPEAAVLLNPQARSAGDVHSTLLGASRLIRPLAAAWGASRVDGKPRRRISLCAWARDDYRGRKRQLILGSGSNAQLTRAYVSAMLNVLVPHIASAELPDSQERVLAFVLDELPALGKVNVVPLIDRARSKGVLCVLGFQDMAQLRMVYGPDLAQAIPSMIATHVICQISPGETRDAIAAMIGKRRVAVFESTTTASDSNQRIVEHHDRPILLPSDLTVGLGPHRSRTYTNGFAVRALVMAGGDILQLDFPGTVLPARRRPFVPAAWLAPVQASAAEPAAGAAATQAPEEAPSAPVCAPVAAPADEAGARAGLMRLAERLDTIRRQKKGGPNC